jgi:hypothetical protein
LRAKPLFSKFLKRYKVVDRGNFALDAMVETGRAIFRDRRASRRVCSFADRSNILRKAGCMVDSEKIDGE